MKRHLVRQGWIRPCRWRDLNPHGLAPRGLRNLCVCQFRHAGTERLRTVPGPKGLNVGLRKCDRAAGTTYDMPASRGDQTSARESKKPHEGVSSLSRAAKGMNVATSNVNGIRARASQVRAWLRRERPERVG